jgi:hypothetical protein
VCIKIFPASLELGSALRQSTEINGSACASGAEGMFRIAARVLIAVLLIAASQSALAEAGY